MAKAAKKKKREKGKRVHELREEYNKNHLRTFLSLGERQKRDPMVEEKIDIKQLLATTKQKLDK